MKSNTTLLEGMHQELLQLTLDKLNPLSKKLGYKEGDLSASIKWKPSILLLGNYSSGKSTLINELIGCDIQETGQAPTDDSFTVISGVHEGNAEDDSSGSASLTAEPKLVESRDGSVLLGDPEYPFEKLKRHGSRFMSHFRLKKVSSPFLNSVSLIDTPGMLDSRSENDRGYDYQEVISDLAEIADLVVVMFDPHKAGTVGESHTSLRNTLPRVTLEHRMVFVLNRIDECHSLVDLLKVYGTLCWNLSQMTGRKDIPPIYLTYSKKSSAANKTIDREFLPLLNNDRMRLTQSIQSVPEYRLDHVISYVEDHCERLLLMASALSNYGKIMNALKLKLSGFSLGLGLLTGIILGALLWTKQFEFLDPSPMSYAIASGIGVCVAVAVYMLAKPIVTSTRHSRLMRNLEELVELDNQGKKERWARVKEKVADMLRSPKLKAARKKINADVKSLKNILDRCQKDFRGTLSDIQSGARAEKASGELVKPMEHSGYSLNQTSRHHA